MPRLANGSAQDQEAYRKIEWLKQQLDSLANFNPDWDMLEATQSSLREHMQIIKTLSAENTSKQEQLDRFETLADKKIDTLLAENRELKEVIPSLKDKLVLPLQMKLMRLEGENAQVRKDLMEAIDEHQVAFEAGWTMYADNGLLPRVPDDMALAYKHHCNPASTGRGASSTARASGCGPEDGGSIPLPPSASTRREFECKDAPVEKLKLYPELDNE